MLSFRPNKLRERQFYGLLLGVLIGLGLFIFLSQESAERYVSLGPMNVGHEDFSCVACHADARGNLIQQLQSNASHLMAMRKKDVDFGTQDVTLDNCLQCHDRPNDRHPTHRFNEPKFKKAIKVINSTTCITCHKEHNGERISVAPINYCMNCHQDMEIENDPLDVPHPKLVANEQWSTCIQCHDFHGNHVYNVPTKMKDTIPLQIIRTYAQGGKDPYGNKKKYLGLSEPEWIKTLKKN